MARLHLALHAYLARQPVGHVLFSPADISFAPDTLLQPDIFVVPLAEARTLDWAAIRRVATLAGIAALGSFIIALILMAKYSLAAGAVDAESVALARTVLPRVESAAEAQAQLDAKLIERGGGGLGFSGAASGLFMAMREAPNVSIANMTHSADGTLRVTLSAPRVEDINMVLIALQEAGFTVTAAPQQGQGGQALADLTVRMS